MTKEKTIAWNFSPPPQFKNIKFTKPTSKTSVSKYAKNVVLQLVPMEDSIAKLNSSHPKRKQMPAVYFWCIKGLDVAKCTVGGNANGTANIQFVASSTRTNALHIVYHGQTKDLKGRLLSYLSDFSVLYDLSIPFEGDGSTVVFKKRANIKPEELADRKNTMTKVLYNFNELPNSFYMELKAMYHEFPRAYEAVILSEYSFIANTQENREKANPVLINGKMTLSIGELPITHQMLDHVRTKIIELKSNKAENLKKKVASGIDSKKRKKKTDCIAFMRPFIR